MFYIVFYGPFYEFFGAIWTIEFVGACQYLVSAVEPLNGNHYSQAANIHGKEYWYLKKGKYLKPHLNGTQYKPTYMAVLWKYWWKCAIHINKAE